MLKVRWHRENRDGNKVIDFAIERVGSAGSLIRTQFRLTEMNG